MSAASVSNASAHDRAPRRSLVVALGFCVLALAGCSGGLAQSPPAPAAIASSGTAITPDRYRLTFSTLMDGASGDWYEMARDIALDAAGNIYVVGGTAAADFPTTPGAYDRTFGGGGSGLGGQGACDAFVMKFTADGKLVWSTYLGGPNYDRAYAVDIAPDGSVFVAGRAGPGFPTTPGVVQPAFAGHNTDLGAYGQQDGFLAKLSPDGGKLAWATYVGDGGQGFIRDMELDAAGRPLVLLAAVSSPMPAFITPNAWRTMPAKSNNVFARISADGTRSEYGTYFGAMGSPSLAIGPDGSVVLSSDDDGSNFTPTPGAYQTRNHGGLDIALVKITPDDKVAFATYLGGSGKEYGDTHQVAVDSLGRIYISGGTGSADFPVTANAFKRNLSGFEDGFVSALSPDGSRLLASTYFGGAGPGGTGAETFEGISIAERAGSPYAVILTGHVVSPGLPASLGALQAGHGGDRDAIVLSLTPDLSTVRFMTYLGGARDDAASASAISAEGARIYFGGHTYSREFPTTPGAVDTEITGTYAAWLAGLTAE